MRDHNQKRAQILTTARQLFAEQGFANTTTRQLNQTIGIADGLLYYYFPGGKQQLLDTIVAQAAAARLDHVDLTLKANDTAELEAQLMAIMTQLWGFLTSPEGYQAVVITIRERPRLSPQAASWLPKVLTTAQDQLTRSLQRLPWLPLAKATCAQLATAIITTFQATMYSQLLLADQRQWTPTVRERLSAQLHFLLTRLLKAEAEA